MEAVGGRRRVWLRALASGVSAGRSSMGVLRLLALAAPILLCLAFASAAVANASFTWTGAAPIEEVEEEWVGEEWSNEANWTEGVPKAGESIERLTFPVLTNPVCLAEEEEEEEYACYFSYNDLEGLSAEAMEVTGDAYFIGGETLTLGAGGLTVAPATHASGAFEFLLTPFKLDATQTWHLSKGGNAGEPFILIGGPITSPSADELTLKLGEGVEPFVTENIEVGHLHIVGANTGEAGVLNGAFPLKRIDVNAQDGQPVSVEHIFLFGSGSMGPLTSDHAEIGIGEGRYPAGGIYATSARFDPSSSLIFKVADSGAEAGQDYSQLTSRGPVALSGATIDVAVDPPSSGKPCPTLTRGQTYTFISTGTLSGAFANAPEWGPELPLKAAAGCPSSSQTMRIRYHESGPVETVTGTVEEAAQKQQEEEAQRLAEQRGKQLAEEEAERKKREEEAKQKVLASMESSPNVTIAPRSIVVSPSGALVVKLKCPPGEASCTGTITLRTLHAVGAGGHKHGAKHKGKVLTLAKATFTVAGGKTEAVRLHLSHKARKMLSHAHLLRALAMLVAGNPSGASHTTREKVTLHARKRGHHKG